MTSLQKTIVQKTRSGALIAGLILAGALSSACTSTQAAAVNTTSLSAEKASQGKTATGQLDKKAKEGFESLTGIEYPDALDEAIKYCHRNLPQPSKEPIAVKGFVYENCRAEYCVPSRLDRGFTFVEFLRGAATSRSIKLVDGQRYRASLISDQDKECAKWDKYIASLDDDYKDSVLATPGKCVVYEPIDTYSTAYEVKSIESVRIEANDFSFRKRGLQLIERESGRVVGSDGSMWFSTTAENQEKTNLSCNHNLSFYKDILIPLQTE